MKDHLTVLLVDDDQDFLEQTEIMLKNAGHRVLPATGRARAEEILEETRPDIALVDLIMDRGDDGFVLAHQIKGKYPEVPVIIITAAASKTGIDFASLPDTGGWIKADAMLQKPVRFEQLETQIKRLCG